MQQSFSVQCIFAAALKAPLGPIPADLIDAIVTDKNLAEILITNLPGYSSYPKEVRDAFKKWAREYGKETKYEARDYRSFAEGGDVEPVAKKTMPLIDMDGKEKDYRETGGFVDMGRMERADDVPARLSKNEFVFTADAVRNAGGGDIDKGAEIMENLMENLEKGGKVSEESQGLEGARDMFATSQRLEGVM